MGSIRVRTLAVLLTIAGAGGNEVVRRAHLSIRPDGQVSQGGSIARRKLVSNGSSVVRKAMSKRHREEQQPTQTWIYAIQTCARASYVRQLETQLSTWLKPVDRDHVLVVGGPHSDCTGTLCNVGAKSVPRKYEVLAEGTAGTKVACNEGADGQNCKEASVLYRGAALAEEMDADWLFHVIDDAYVFLPRVWKVLEGYDPSKPQVFADFGCGSMWKHQSEGGTIPMPQGWVEPKPSCDRVEREGGICTGAGYIVSRGALKLLRQNYTLPSFIDHYTEVSVGRASDSTSSCLFYERNISVQKWPGGLKMAQTHNDWVEDETKWTKNAKAIVARHAYGLVHVNFGRNKSAIPRFMEQLHAL